VLTHSNALFMTVIQTIDIKTIQTRLNITSCNDKFIHQKFTIHNAPKFEMCRMEVYFIALLHKGEVLIETDLTSQAIQAPALLVMAPSVIRKFINASSSYNSEAIFFDKSFFLEHLADTNYLDKYNFFYTNQEHQIPISKSSYKEVSQYFNIVKRQLKKPGKLSNDIVRNILQIILLEIAALVPPKAKKDTYSHNRLICSVFKADLEKHFRIERKVSFYASLQHLSSKYFSSIILQQTGKTAGDTIDEKVQLEAQALLHKKELTISQIAGLLSFTDASNFSKYYKNLTGHSPNDYRKSM